MFFYKRKVETGKRSWSSEIKRKKPQRKHGYRDRNAKMPKRKQSSFVGKS